MSAKKKENEENGARCTGVKNNEETQMEKPELAHPRSPLITCADLILTFCPQILSGLASDRPP
tara:strand:+ start:730 stop:918 length:189 start_codon:yes stop_codon:yes gene_type:complete